MAQPEVTTRVNKSMLPNYINRTVRAVGKVTTCNTDTLEFQLSDGGIVQVKKVDATLFEPGTILEIIGQVVDDHTIKEFNSSSFNAEFDFENFNSLLTLTRRFPELFGTV